MQRRPGEGAGVRKRGSLGEQKEDICNTLNNKDKFKKYRHLNVPKIFTVTGNKLINIFWISLFLLLKKSFIEM